MFGFGSWKQLLAGRGYCSWGEIGHHNVGVIWIMKSIGVGLGNHHGLQTMGHSMWLSKRGLLVPPRWGKTFKGGGEAGGDGR